MKTSLLRKWLLGGAIALLATSCSTTTVSTSIGEPSPASENQVGDPEDKTAVFVADPESPWRDECAADDLAEPLTLEQWMGVADVWIEADSPAVTITRQSGSAQGRYEFVPTEELASISAHDARSLNGGDIPATFVVLDRWVDAIEGEVALGADLILFGVSEGLARVAVAHPDGEVFLLGECADVSYGPVLSDAVSRSEFALPPRSPCRSRERRTLRLRGDPAGDQSSDRVGGPAT